MKTKITYLLLLIASLNGYSQFSKNHYIPPLTAGSDSSIAPSIAQYLYISTPSTSPVKVKITPVGGTPITLTVTQTTPIEYQVVPLPSSANARDTQLFATITAPGSGKFSNKGYVIEADDLVYANIRVTSNINSSNQVSQAGGLVSKGTSALGKTFRIGGMLNKELMNSNNGLGMINFASFMATENDTKVTITLPNAPIGTLRMNGTAYTAPFTVTLNKYETYIVGIQNASDSQYQSTYMLGGLISSDKNIVVNAGSIGGNNYTTGISPDNTSYNGRGKDYGFDQIVSYEKTGKEYIFVKGAGSPGLERILIIAHVDGTQIYKNGTTTTGTLVTTLNAGQYYVFNGNEYNPNGNLYVTTTENVFAYQSVAGSNDAGNQNMFFVPPLNCATPSVVNNIPYISKIGVVSFDDTKINIVTERGSIVTVNGVSIPTTPVNVIGTGAGGTPQFVRYTVNKNASGGNLTGNITVTSTSQVYVSYFGNNNNATFGSYYSGFDTKPNITSTSSVTVDKACISNTVLNVAAAAATDTFQWLFNGTPIPTAEGGQSSPYTPKSIAAGGKGPGYYSVTKISSCLPTTSDPVAVSECAVDSDGDGINNNIDIDSDNDGITNTTESYGDQNINTVNPSGGTLTVGTYNNTYTGTTTTTGTGNIFTGNANGNFTTSLAAGNTNSLTYNLNFTTPISLGVKYNPLLGATVNSLSDATFAIKTDINKTITVLNPSNQLLIDTDYDGIYESGVTQFSSFDVRFILNPAVLLPTSGPAPAIDFKFQTYMANSISFTHQNLSSNQPNNASFSFYAVSVPRDTDGDGIPDQLDTDSDNDGILDIIEGQAGNKVLANLDSNNNGLDNNFEPIIAPVDTDGDGIPDYLDLDSDNDGILDSVEKDIDTDTDTIKNFRDKDSDADTCFDAVEAGFLDPDGDGILGTSPITVDINGKVTGGAYTTPNGNYLITGVPVINTQPISTTNCQTQSAEIKIETNTGNDFTWEVSTNGGTIWTVVTDNATYAGATTDLLKITGATNGYKYRVNLSNPASACKALTSNVVDVILSGSPVVVDVAMAQCDTDLDGKMTFDLTSKESQISANYTIETFKYYTTQAGANTSDATVLIPNPATYTNATAHNMDVWTRVTNAAGCSNVAKITLKVGVKTPTGFVFASPPAPVCDDAIQDGITTFDLTATKTAFEALFPSTGYTVTFYANQADATAQTAPITNLSNYRNTIINTHPIWVRVNNTNTTDFSGCYSLDTYFSLNVEALPVANTVTIARQCDDNQDGILTFNTSSLQNTLLNGQLNKNVTYFDATNNPLKDADGNLITSPFPASFKTSSQTIKAVVTNNTTQGCTAQTTITFTVDPAPIVNNTTITICDTDLDGFASFDLTVNNNQISANAASEVFTYYITPSGAQNATPAELIANNTAYTNTTKHTMDVWVRVVSANGCPSVAKLTLNVVVAFPSNYNIVVPPVCDDDRDGITTFDISATETTMKALLPPTGYSIDYYKNQADATAQTNKITNLSSYRNVGYPNTQQIWIRVNNTLSPSCFSTGNYITLNVEAKPTANPVIIPRQCDDNQDGIFTFNTSTLHNSVLNGQLNKNVTYFDEVGNALPTPFPATFTTTSQTIKAVVTNNTPQGCSDSTLIVFTVDVKPVANVVAPLIACDNELDPLFQDGKYPFNTASIQPTILGTQNGTMNVKYFDQAGNALPTPLPNPFLTGTQTITVRVENPLNTSCPATETVSFIVNPLPNINLNTNGGEDELICSDSPGLLVQLNAGIQDGTPTSDYTYQWSKDGINLAGETSYNLSNVNTEGIYRVRVTNASGCFRTRTIKVKASNIATIQSIDIVDYNDINTVTVHVTGAGDYGYNLDDESGYFQESIYFYDVQPGIHEVFIKDKNGCGIVSQTIAVVGAPKFFTPNNDGFNDTWNVKGIEATANAGSQIYIFDRYGKLIKEINTSGLGWDGNYNGYSLPADDYWYNLQLVDGRIIKGHFSLKR